MITYFVSSAEVITHAELGRRHPTARVREVQARATVWCMVPGVVGGVQPTARDLVAFARDVWKLAQIKFPKTYTQNGNECGAWPNG